MAVTVIVIAFVVLVDPMDVDGDTAIHAATDALADGGDITAVAGG